MYEARLSTYEFFFDENTWGAFQAYGEPSFVLDPESLPLEADGDNFRPVALQEIIARIDLLRNELAYNRSPGQYRDAVLSKTLDRLLRPDVSTAWLNDPEAQFSLGRLYADAGDFERARQSYEKAIAIEDKRGRVPVTAIEQLANMEVRQGEKLIKADDAKGEALLRRGLDRLLDLVRAAAGWVRGLKHRSITTS